jgi:hypothetical protein
MSRLMLQKRTAQGWTFFIISRDLLNSVTECSILPGLQNKLFDHHAVRIDFNAKKKIITPPTISKQVMKDQETELVGGLAAAESYLLYSNILLPADRNQLREGLGSAWRDLREAGPGNNYAVPGDVTEFQILNREAKLASVREYLEFFPFELVRDGELNISDDLFLECLVNSMRNGIVSYQTFLKKPHTHRKKLCLSVLRI